MTHTMVEVSTDSREDVEFLGRQRNVNVRVGKERISMSPELAHEVADAIHAQAKLIEDDHPFHIVFK